MFKFGSKNFGKRIRRKEGRKEGRKKGRKETNKPTNKQNRKEIEEEAKISTTKYFASTHIKIVTFVIVTVSFIKIVIQAKYNCAVGKKNLL